MRRNDPHENLPRGAPHFDPGPAFDDSPDTPDFALGTLEMEKLDRLDDDEEEIVELVHDLKNPLTTIALEMSLIEDTLGHLATPDVRAAMARITRNIAFVDRLVQDMLDASAIDAGAFSVQRRPTEICGLLHQVIERTVSSRDRSRIYVEASGRITVPLDAHRIERVIANLVQNALKYAPATTGVAVRVERLVGRVRVSVIDSGPGIGSADQVHLFERHQRTDVARMHDGSGLGLYISRRIIEAHGGIIGVDSVLNIGSRFYFEVPA